MAIKKFSELDTKTTIPSGTKLVAVTGTGQFGRNLNVSPWELRVPGLPAGYTPCQYVESNSNCYVDTGIASSERVGIQMTYQYAGPASHDDGLIIIGAGSATSNTRQWINDASDGKLHVGWGADEPQGVSSTTNVAWGQVNFMMSGTATCSVTGAATITLKTGQTFSGFNLYLFANNNGTSADMKTKAKLFRCRISVGKVVVRDFYPILRDSDSKYGLFDTVEGKVYFPGAGSLTGSVCGSTWDYSYLNSQTGGSGAYIDEYPTPDSTSFVEASGVEAGMKQIREALMVGPMVPGNDSLFFPTLGNELLPNNTIGTGSSRTAFFNIPNIFNTIREKAWTDKWAAWTIGALTRKGVRWETNIAITGVRSSYLTYIGYGSGGNGVSIYPNDASCDFMFRPLGDPWKQAQEAICRKDNLFHSVRIVADKITLFSEYVYRLTKLSQNPILAYAPLCSKEPLGYDSWWVLEPSTYKGVKNVNIYCYYPSRNSNKATSAFSYTPLNMPNVLYLLKYIGKNAKNIIQTGINAKYFSYDEEGTAPTEQTSIHDKDTYVTTYSTTNGDSYCKTVITRNVKDKAGDEGVVIQTITITKICTCTKSSKSIVATTEITDDLATKPAASTITKTWTLRADTDANYGTECAALRNALWNTDGVVVNNVATSTGLLDGTYQVYDGTHAVGSAFANYWSLSLWPNTEVTVS